MKNLSGAAGAFLLACSPASAQEPACSFESAAGTEIEFSAIKGSQGVADDFSPYKDFSAPIEVAALQGRRAKVVGATTGDVRTDLQLILDDCSTLFMRDDDGMLLSTDQDRTGVRIIKRSEDHPSLWNVRKSVDPVDDAKICTVTTSGIPAPVFIWHSRDGFAIGAVGADFPGRPLALRADRAPAVEGEGPLIGAVAQRVMSQIRGGAGSLLVAGYRWPNDFRASATYATDGLVTRIEECERFMR